MFRTTDLRIAVVAALSAALPIGALAAPLTQVQADRSSITFGYEQMGVKMDGRFRTFRSQLSFDPVAPDAAKVAVDVDLASIDTGTGELDSEAAGKPWFNTPAFPTARFVSDSVKPLGGNRYAVAGKLTIKGRTRDVVVPASFTPQGTAGVFDGSFTLKRGEFAIGEGAWSAFDVVANDVQVRFRITATAR